MARLGSTSERRDFGVLVSPSRRVERQTWITPWSRSTWSQVSARSSPGRGPSVMDRTKSASEEPLRVGHFEVLELDAADRRIDPLLGLTAIGGHGVRIEGKGIEPIADVLPDGVGRRGVNARVDLLVQRLELVPDLGLGLAAYCPSSTPPLTVVPKRDRADVALVGLVPRRLLGSDGCCAPIGRHPFRLTCTFVHLSPRSPKTSLTRTGRADGHAPGTRSSTLSAGGGGLRR
jgi:hypothetical protein